jgi:DNA-binding Xre family transcriptional regulator
MKKKDLQPAAWLSSTTISKLSNHENVNIDVLIKVFTILGFDIGDIMELVPNAQPDTNKITCNYKRGGVWRYSTILQKE